MKRIRGNDGRVMEDKKEPLISKRKRQRGMRGRKRKLLVSKRK